MLFWEDADYSQPFFADEKTFFLFSSPSSEFGVSDDNFSIFKDFSNTKKQFQFLFFTMLKLYMESNCSCNFPEYSIFIYILLTIDEYSRTSMNVVLRSWPD